MDDSYYDFDRDVYINKEYGCWKIGLKKKGSEKGEEIEIQFKEPVWLPKISTKAQTYIKYWKNHVEEEELEEEKPKQERELHVLDKGIIKNLLESAIKRKYHDKAKQSFDNMYSLVVFNKIVDFYNRTKNINIDQINNELANNFFNYYENHKSNLIKKYVTEYKQYIREFDIEQNEARERRDTIEKYYKSWKEKLKASEDNEIKNVYRYYWDEYYRYNDPQCLFSKKFPSNNFKSMITETKNCAYCGISAEQISLLREKGKIHTKSGRGFSLEIDRKNPNEEYTKDNCCMVCYWCNNAKTDEFTFEEFEPIAKGINEVWNRRLKEISAESKIEFSYGNSKPISEDNSDCK